jgi:hypothetical protein
MARFYCHHALKATMGRERLQRIRRGAFRSVAALEAAIREYLEHHNASPKPFKWTADADLILDRVKKVIERTYDSGH